MHALIERNLQKVLNHYLALDPESKVRLHAIQGKVVRIELLEIGQAFQIIFTDEQIYVKSAEFAKPDTIIKGTPLSLLHLSLNNTDRKRFFAEDVSIEGDLELGQKVIDIFDTLEIDWEEYLSHWIGDVPAHQVGRVFHKMKKFSKKIRETFTQNINEFIHEEINLFPPREALHDFFHDVDSLRMDTDRLEARVMQLTKTMDAKKEA